MLDIARIEAGGMNVVIAPFDPVLIIKDVIEMLRPQATAAAITIAVTEPSAASIMMGDAHRTKQALVNLVSNAIKYNFQGGSVTFWVGLSHSGLMRISVADTGPGIPTDKLYRLFSPFDRLDAEGGAVEGTGLGLALSRALAEAMGGALTVVSNVGGGATFSIELPGEQSMEAHGSTPPTLVG